ncbi:protein O-mannosyl-transferase TMTC2 [Wyeomyia smithii]|uniref:protein O-mannosyl-transferase TMTC2 n=1 Tax=Wyeomyia smithii TaxID=174621 RepID=UPI002467E8EA|nr:protein O-mannosyl-transferase TMTC2 [Wyeomyia smithii]XP_055542493.1 protein O-mannosyl-transferase TMTC2 [Wyeomyia smithii]XP_055542494.1 protein O-mannosyl-transferase TMTC2 [Wyeomyia smithii]
MSHQQRNKSSMDYVSLGCCTLAFALYVNTLSAGFVYDDRRAVLGNPDVLSSTAWYQMLHNDFWGTPLTDSGSHGSYRPLCVASFKINYLLDGFKPVGYHLVNVLLHCVATVLVVRLARHIIPSRYGAAIAGLLFAAHPIHTEAVAGVVGRADLTACVFYLLALLAYIRHIHWRQCTDLRHWLALGFTILLATAAVLCKETAVTALVVCAIYDVIKGYAGSRDKHRFRSVGVLMVALGTMLHMRLSLPRPAVLFSSADNPTAKIGSAWTRLLTFLYLPVFNFRMLVYPDVLSFDWGMDAIPRIVSLFERKNVLTAMFYGLLFKAVWINFRTLVKHSLPSVNSSFNRKLASKLAMARAGRESIVVEDLCAYCKHDYGLHHSNQCRALHNNNNMSSIVCGCLYPQCKYLLLSPSIVSGYFPREDGQKAATTSGTVNGYWPKQQYWHRDKPVVNGFSSDHLPFTLTMDTSCRTMSSSCSSSSSLSSSSSSSSTSSSSSSTSSSASSVSSSSTDYLMTKPNASAAILISISLLTLPFLPATNLLFYVGFVVAERILYLPSVGYCLLIGLGVGRLIDGTAGSGQLRNSSVSNNSGDGGSRISSSGFRGKNSKCSDGDRYKYRGNSDNTSGVGSVGAKHHKNHSAVSGATGSAVFARKSANNRSGFSGRKFGTAAARSNNRDRYQQRKRQIILLCFGVLLLVYSGKTLLRNLDWRDEESLFRSAIGVNPPKALGNLGSVLSAQGRHQEAKEALKAALSYRPNMADVHYNLGILLQNQQDYSEAVESFRKAIQFRPSLALAYLNLGTSLIALGRCQEAASILREGAKLDGAGLRDRAAHDNARISALLQLGNLYADQGKLQPALAVYREALHILPDRYPPQGIYHRLGEVFARLNQWTEAERFQRAALEAQPDHVAAHLSYGSMLARNSSRTSEAEQWFKRALRLAPSDASVFHHYADFLTSVRRTAEACQHRVKAAELAPEDYSLVTAAASALRLLDRKTEAERWYRQAVQLRPEEARAHTNLGAILHLLGRTEEAARSYKEALRLHPNDLTTLTNLAKLGIAEIS